MAYKQPYKQVSKSNDGASVAFLAAIPALIAKIGAVAGKAGVIAAKAGKAGAVAAKAGKTATAAAKTGKAAKGAGQLTKMATKGAKTIKTSSSMPKLQTLSQSVDAGKKGGKFAQKIGDAGKKALDKGKDIVEKGKQKVDKFKEGYDKAAGKVADATGFEKEAVKEFGTNQASNVASNIQSKIQESKEQQPAERSTPNILPKNTDGSYEDPQGPNMFDYRKNYGPSIKSKYNNVGPSMKEIKTTTADGGEVIHRSDGASSKFGTKSETESNLFKDGFGDATIGNFSAPITIKGVTFDAGDVLRLSMMGYRAGKKGVENRKAITSDAGFRKAKSNLKSYKENKLNKPDKFSDFLDKKENIQARRKNIKSIKKKLKK